MSDEHRSARRRFFPCPGPHLGLLDSGVGVFLRAIDALLLPSAPASVDVSAQTALRPFLFPIQTLNAHVKRCCRVFLSWTTPVLQYRRAVLRPSCSTALLHNREVLLQQCLERGCLCQSQRGEAIGILGILIRASLHEQGGHARFPAHCGCTRDSDGTFRHNGGERAAIRPPVRGCPTAGMAVAPRHGSAGNGQGGL